MSWNCDGKPRDGQPHPEGSGPHESCSLPDYLDECPQCRLPKSAIVVDQSEGVAGSKNIKPPLIETSSTSYLLVKLIATIAIVGLILGVIIVLLKKPGDSCQKLDPQSCFKLALTEVNDDVQQLQGHLEQHFQDEQPSTLKRIITSAEDLENSLSNLEDLVKKDLITPLSTEQQDALDDLKDFANWIDTEGQDLSPVEFTDNILKEQGKASKVTMPVEEKTLIIQSLLENYLFALSADNIICSISEEYYSSGEQVLFTDGVNSDLDLGVQEFAKENYEQSKRYFEKAIASSPNHPEPYIYLQNTEAHLNENQDPYVVAAVVPVKKRKDSALEILRGIADAQQKFNREQLTKNQPLLEIRIVNDDNSDRVGKCVGQSLAEDKSIWAVIGHNSSKVSQAVLPIYEEADLAMISPTSTSIYLTGSNFFRTVSSDRQSGELLAQYVSENNLDSVITIFYVKGDSYSESLKQAFVDDLSPNANVTSIDISGDDFEINQVLTELLNQQTKLVALFPNTDQVSRGINILRSLEPHEIKVVGGDTLYTSQVIIDGGNATDGLVLVTPMIVDDQYFNKTRQNWLGQVSWRTASSYDAMVALSHILPQVTTRSQVMNALRDGVNLSGSETAGQPLDFDQTGQRQISPQLVQACVGVPSPQGSKLGFAPLDVCQKSLTVTPSTPVPNASSPSSGASDPVPDQPPQPPSTPVPQTPPPYNPPPKPNPPPTSRPAPNPPPDNPAPDGPPLWGPGSEPATPQQPPGNVW